MVVFRKLALNGEAQPANAGAGARCPPALTKLATRPVTFVVMDRALVTVRAAHSRTIETARTRLLEYRPKANGNSHGGRPPASPRRTDAAPAQCDGGPVPRHCASRCRCRSTAGSARCSIPQRPFNDWTDAARCAHRTAQARSSVRRAARCAAGTARPFRRYLPWPGQQPRQRPVAGAHQRRDGAHHPRAQPCAPAGVVDRIGGADPFRRHGAPDQRDHAHADRDHRAVHAADADHRHLRHELRSTCRC